MTSEGTDALIERFCEEYDSYHAISPARRVMRRRVLADFADGLELDEVTAGKLQSYLSSAVAGGLAATTVQRNLKAIRPFLTWLWQQKIIDAETLMELRTVKPPRGAYGAGKPNPYNRAEVARFWVDLADAYPWARDGDEQRGAWYFERFQRGSSPWRSTQPYARRAQIEAIASLALFGGLRRDEIFILGVEDAHPENDYIAVTGAAKNRAAEPKPRPVPWTSEYLRAAMGRWLSVRDALAPPHGTLWLSLYQDAHRLKPLRHRQFEMALHGIGRGYEYRRMRHTCATELLRHGYPLESVQKLMGHSRLQQTLAYAEIVGSDLEVVARRHRTNVDSHLAPAVTTKEAA